MLWIQTDISTSVLNKGDYANIGNNQMLAADVQTGEIRRFLTGPTGCEVTGVVTVPDGKTMFVNIQHPGETPGERNDPAHPTAVSAWPSGTPHDRQLWSFASKMGGSSAARCATLATLARALRYAVFNTNGTTPYGRTHPFFLREQPWNIAPSP